MPATAARKRVTRHGREAVVVLAAEEFARLNGADARRGTLAEFFGASPLRGSGIELDTNVISELIRSEPDRKVVRWIEEIEETILFLSVLTLGEIQSGIERLGPGRRRGRLESWLAADLPLRFQDRILSVNKPVAERWGRLTVTAAKKGRPVPVIDGLLAATALHHDLTLVTRNGAAVSGTGVAIANPWQ